MRQQSTNRGATSDSPHPSIAAGLHPDTLTDRGNAKLFISLYGQEFRHVHGLGWYRWCGYRWEVDQHHTVLWTAGEMADALATSDPTGTYQATNLVRHRQRSLSTTGIQAMLAQVAASPDVALSAQSLDADPHALCTPEGVVDLKNGTLAPPAPSIHLHSRSTSVTPHHMPTPRWHRFLTDTFGEDAAGQEMIDFLQLLLGYSITGDVGSRIMPFLHGKGMNGKSVLLDVMVKLMGDYADCAPPGFLMQRHHERHHERHPTDLADLHGRRIVVCSEVNPGDRFDEARVKYLTGSDRIKARRMREHSFTFTPTHKLWLIGNHRPEVGTGGYAFWRRVRMIPFERIVADDRQVENLADVLVAEEGPGILRWLVNGARVYLSGHHDLSGPERVRTATTTYAETEDHFGRFLGECCRVAPQLRAEQAELYSAYLRWSEYEGTSPLTAMRFASRVREALSMRSAADMLYSNQRKFYPGIGLLSSAANPGSSA
ncbi:DNA primase family protein [Streptomyces zaomyceticus]|uniref:DNA primase family protein n=1 Tax=Streptomyces zaomyceticus TaxID=68286 RepID=UPI0036833A8A